MIWKKWFPGPRAETWAFAAAVLLFGWGLGHDFGSHPLGLALDEVTNGLNAFCISRDLRDQHGAFLPLFFSAMDDDRSPLFIYPQALSLALLGATDLAVRLPAALFALLGAGTFALLIDRLTKRPVLARWLGVAWFTVPCFFTFARIGLSEACCVPFFLLLALHAALSFQERPTTRNAALTGAALGLCFYSYAPERLLAPLSILCALAVFAFPVRNNPWRGKLWALAAGAAVLGLPALLYQLRHPASLGLRFSHISIFADQPSLSLAASRFVRTYLTHLIGLNFLFRTGPALQIYNPGEGSLPLWLFGPLVVGGYSLWRRREQPWTRLAFAMWVTAPLAVSLTWGTDLPHIARAIQVAPLALLVGSLAIADWLESGPPRGLVALATATMLFEGAMTLSLYFGAYREAIAEDGGWYGGAGEALRAAFQARQPGEPIFITPAAFDYRATFIGFYSGMPPELYRKVFDGPQVDTEPVGIFRLKTAHLASAGELIANELPPSGILVSETPLPEVPSLLPLQPPEDPDGPKRRWAAYRIAPAR